MLFRSLLLAAVGSMFFVFKNPLAGDESGISRKAIRGLRFGDFETEIDLGDWRSVAEYKFENGFKNSSDESQSDITPEGATEIVDGMLRLESPTARATVEVARNEDSWPDGLAVNLRFLPEEYDGRADDERVMLDFSIGWQAGLFLAHPKWKTGPPTVLDGRRRQLAPPGVVEDFLDEGQWHDLWIVLDEESYRIWVDGEAVYGVGGTKQLEDWKEWETTDAHLRVGGFTGRMDHINVMVKKWHGEG